MPFYTLPSPVPAGAPGTILRTEKLSSAPDGTIGYRVLYHTTDLTGADIIGSGIVVAPSAPPPPGGRAVVGWGHFTTGAAQHCAPSNGIDPFDMIEGIEPLMEAGYAVAAADFPGMGVPGPNSYLVGINEGNSVLDADPGRGEHARDGRRSRQGRRAVGSLAGRPGRAVRGRVGGAVRPGARRSAARPSRPRPPTSARCWTTTSRTSPA